MTDPTLLAVGVIAVPLLAAFALAVSPASWRSRVALCGAAAAFAAALALCATQIENPERVTHGRWLAVDTAGVFLIAVISLVGLASVVCSGAYIEGGARLGEAVRPGVGDRQARLYYVALFAFWGTVLAVPVAANLALAWLLVEATTVTSVILVGYTGRPRALEAAWKYLILTSLGLAVALLGIVFLAAGVPGRSLGSLTWQSLAQYQNGSQTALVAYLFIIAGLAAKIGWAPVHNWLPDAHSEAPAPVSALLSAALLPTVILVAWRCETALSPVIGGGTAREVLWGFGLVSLAVAAPFLWRPLAWKRLLAYSSLEHMGMIALGLGFGSSLALAGVVIHVAGHAVAKALGFYAATPLLQFEPRAARHPATGVGRREPRLAVPLGVSLYTLAGIPPSPIFVSEVLIIAAGFQTGNPWPAAIAALLLALGFLGLGNAMLETIAGKARRRVGHDPSGLRSLTVITALAVVLLLALTVSAMWLPHSSVVAALARGAG